MPSSNPLKVRGVYKEMMNMMEFIDEPVTNGDQELIHKYWTKQLGKVETISESDVAFIHKCCECPERADRKNTTAVHVAAGATLILYGSICVTVLGGFPRRPTLVTVIQLVSAKNPITHNFEERSQR